MPRSWRGGRTVEPAGVTATVRQLRHVAPAVALLWVPVLIAVWAGLPGADDLQRGIPMLRAMLIAGLAPLMVAAGIARLRSRSAVSAVRLLWLKGWLTERPLRHVLLSVSFAAFFWAFASWKTTIPMVQPFAWDERLSTLDVWLGGGRPDALLATFFGSATTIIALDRLYETWWLAQFVLILWQVWQPSLVKAKRFLVAFALVWIVLGIFLATAFSSAGPCFAHLVTGTEHYHDLLARLRTADAVAPLTTLQAQEFLWRVHLHGLTPPGGGISAFPSLHVAVATLGALALQERREWLGAVAWMYVGLIWIASVMLGWHYAVDGLVSVLGAAALWAVAGALTAPFVSIAHTSRRASSVRQAVPELVAADDGRVASDPTRRSWSLWP